NQISAERRQQSGQHTEQGTSKRVHRAGSPAARDATSYPASSRARAARTGRLPVQSSGSVKRDRAKTEVVVKLTVPAATCRSSTASTSVTRRSEPLRTQ